MASDEEARAAEFRRQMTARARAEDDRRHRGLPGDPAAAGAAREAWEPWTDTDRTWDPPPCIDDGKGMQIA